MLELSNWGRSKFRGVGGIKGFVLVTFSLKCFIKRVGGRFEGL